MNRQRSLALQRNVRNHGVRQRGVLRKMIKIEEFCTCKYFERSNHEKVELKKIWFKGKIKDLEEKYKEVGEQFDTKINLLERKTVR